MNKTSFTVKYKFKIIKLIKKQNNKGIQKHKSGVEILVIKIKI